METSHTRNAPNQVASRPSIAPETQIGLVALQVADLERSLAYYTTALGFTLLDLDGPNATLGAGGTPLLLLSEVAGARPFPGFGVTGLYHFAILTPSRADLGRWLHHWLEVGDTAPGQGDHLVSEAFYLTDPDGNGIEVYQDRPRDTWRWSNGHVQMATDPVDVRGLLAEAAARAETWTGLPAGTRLGHMHLQIGDVAQAAAFYVDVLGFDETARISGALFVSAGGYHHHLGLNTWQSRGATPAPDGTAGLRFFVIELPHQEALNAIVERIQAAGLPYTETEPGSVAVQDPWRNTLLLRVGSIADAQTAATLRASV